MGMAFPSTLNFTIQDAGFDTNNGSDPRAATGRQSSDNVYACWLRGENGLHTTSCDLFRARTVHQQCSSKYLARRLHRLSNVSIFEVPWN